MTYTLPMPSSSETIPGTRRRHSGRLRVFWQRVSEGRQIEDLWHQFSADARSSFGFYKSDVDWEEVQKLPPWRKPLHIGRQFFWALLLKMSPARRVLLLAALVILFLSGLNLLGGNQTVGDVKLEFMAGILLLFLLSLELADRVTMKRDLEIAREIQTWLVPSAPPEIPGGEIAFATRPQNSVAGDYYDAFYPMAATANPGKLVLVIADVAGKSVPAALLMATLQASLRTLASENPELVELVHRLNRYSCAHSLDGRRFTTAVIGQLDPVSRTFAYVNAGHNAPILRRGNGALEKLESGGLPLGIESPTRYEAASIQLAAGDALIFFTDGVVEAFNEDGQEFGNERWCSAISALPECSAQDSLNFLMRPVDAFVGATRQSDDITCMVFRSK